MKKYKEQEKRSLDKFRQLKKGGFIMIKYNDKVKVKEGFYQGRIGIAREEIIDENLRYSTLIDFGIEIGYIWLRNELLELNEPKDNIVDNFFNKDCNV